MKGLENILMSILFIAISIPGALFRFVLLNLLAILTFDKFVKLKTLWRKKPWDEY